MERANINMDNWIQETCYMSVVTSGPDGEKQLQKNYIVWKTKMSGEPYIKQMCLKAEG